MERIKHIRRKRFKHVKTGHNTCISTLRNSALDQGDENACHTFDPMSQQLSISSNLKCRDNKTHN